MTFNKTFHHPLFDRISDNKRNKILNIAIAEFAGKGFASANINIIAKKCEISIGSMYKYFSSKEDLFFTVVSLCLKVLEENLQQIQITKGTVFDKINNIVDAIFENRIEYKLINKLYSRLTIESNPELAKKLADKIETLTATTYSSLLRQAKEEGIIAREADERVFAFCIDNIFIMLQFSLSSNYFQDRFTIYLGDDSEDNYDFIKGQIHLFIKRALSI